MASAVLLISTKGALSERKEKPARQIDASLIFSTEIKSARKTRKSELASESTLRRSSNLGPRAKEKRVIDEIAIKIA